VNKVEYNALYTRSIILMSEYALKETLSEVDRLLHTLKNMPF